MRQYHAAKQQAPNALLLFRLGDFYELFFDDAVLASRELEITLTSRNKEKGEPVPMCGVPAHAVENYIARLIQKGYRVAICDQMEDPRLTKKIVRREITRILTPGTVTDSALLRPHENNYLAAAAVRQGRAGLAWVDISTGEFRTTEIDSQELETALEQLNVRELLFAGPARDAPAPGPKRDLLLPAATRENAPQGRWMVTPVEAWTFAPDHSESLLKEHFKLLALDGCGLAGRPLAIGAAGALLHYLRDTQRSALDHLDRPSWFDRSRAMLLDPVTVRNLELVEPLFSADLDARRDATLLSVLDQTLTGMGGRLLRRRLLRPSLDRAEIEARLDAVEWLKAATIERAKLREILGRIQDLERLLAPAAAVARSRGNRSPAGCRRVAPGRDDRAHEAARDPGPGSGSRTPARACHPRHRQSPRPAGARPHPGPGAVVETIARRGPGCQPPGCFGQSRRSGRTAGLHLESNRRRAAGQSRRRRCHPGGLQRRAGRTAPPEPQFPANYRRN